MAKPSKTAKGVAIGIGQLPPSAGFMQEGRPYAVTSDAKHIESAFLISLIRQALIDRRKIVLIAGFKPEALLAALSSHGIDVQQEQISERLVLLMQFGNQEAALLQYGPTRLLEEIDDHCDPHHSLIVIAPADELLSHSDPRLANQQAKIYGRWFRDRRATGLFLFNRKTQSQQSGQLVALDGLFSGLAHLRSSGLRTHWEVDHWSGSEGSLINRRYGISEHSKDKLLVADGGEMAGHEQRILAAPDRDSVFATNGSIMGAKGLPANWHIVQAPAELTNIASTAVAATFIMELDQERSIEAMAELIHGLRQNGGNGIKIVVRERTHRLRYNHEMLLMRLGANAVIDASLSFSRFLAVIDSLRDQLFTREIPANFDTALLAAMPPTEGGYLRPQEFCGAVSEAVDRGAAIGMHSVLLRLIISPQLSHLEVLKNIQLKRPGDMFTADDRSVYIFLFACREPDIDTALETVISKPLADLFEGQIRWIHSDVVRSALDNLQRRLRSVAVADFTTMLKHQPSTVVVDVSSPEPELNPPTLLPTIKAFPLESVKNPRSIHRSPIPMRPTSA